jgi:tungstate transport system substrate-binding protein
VDVLAAFTAVRDAHLATPGSVMFLSAADGCGAHARELALWRQAGIAPQPPWYGSVARGARLIENARARGAYALVERGEWLASGGAPLAVLADGGPLLAEQVHVMRAFRVNHPAGKMFVAWIAGTRGGNVVSGHRGYARVTA